MQSTKSTDLIGQIKFLLLGQLDVTRPFLFLRRVWLARLGDCNLMQSGATSSTCTAFFYCAKSLITVHSEKISVKKSSMNAQSKGKCKDLTVN